MSYAAFYLLEAPNIINEIMSQAGYKRWNSLNEGIIANAITPSLRKYGLYNYLRSFQREMINAFINSKVVNSSHQFNGNPFLADPRKVMQKLLEPRLFRIESVERGMMLSPQNPVRLLNPNRGQVVTWKLKPVGFHGQPYVIHTPVGDRALTVMEKYNSIPIRPLQYQNLPGQKWVVLPMDHAGEIFKIISAFSNNALDVQLEASNKETANIQHREFHGGPNQQWRIRLTQLS